MMCSDARCWLVNVQVTVSPADTLMLPIGLPSSQLLFNNVHPVGVLSSALYVPGGTFGVV